ncbi:MAG: HU family DNA-binding protein [Acidimicrobiales bacterium]
MNKSELIQAVGTSADVDKRTAERAVEAFVDTVVSEVRAGNKVTLIGFGTFTPKARAARVGRNPRTGEPVKVKASKGVGFSAGSAFKAALNTKGRTSASKAAAKSTKASKAAPAKSTKTTKAAPAKSVAKSSTSARAASKAAGGRSTAATKTSRSAGSTASRKR